jgi:uncharacterized membrane protein YqiK
MIMSNSNFNTKFLYQLAQTETTNESNSIETIDSNLNTPLVSTLNLISPGSLIGGGIAGILLVLMVAGFIYTRLYRIIKPNEAIIRSGGFGPFWSGKTAFTQGGCVVIPGLHQIIGVPLSEVRIQVTRKGESYDDQGAVRTKDYLRAKLTATMYVVVDINAAETSAARLCNDASGKVTEADIRAAVEARCDDALRNAAKQRTLTEIDSDKVGFGTDVKNSLQQSLDSLGLTLQDVTLTDIEEDATAYRDNDYFDVQGKREREEKVCQSKLETAKVQSETETQLAAVDRDKALELQTIQLEKEQAEATLKAETTVIKAEKQREAEEGQEKQMALLAKKREAFELEKEQARMDKETSIQEAEQDAQKKLLLKQQEVEVADINRETAVKKAKQTSEQELILKRQEVLVADQEAQQRVAASEKQTNEIQAQVATAESAITTATKIEVAERNKKITELLAEQQANARKILQETDAAKLYSFGDGNNNSSSATKQLASISGLGMLQEILESNVGSQAVSTLTGLLNNKAVGNSSQNNISSATEKK